MVNENKNNVTDSIHRVLARKYRPLNFTKLVGQNNLIKTLSGSRRAVAGRGPGVVNGLLCGDLSAGRWVVRVSLFFDIEEFNDERRPAGDVSFS